jgi:spoIIIJ-associated protein
MAEPRGEREGRGRRGREGRDRRERGGRERAGRGRPDDRRAAGAERGGRRDEPRGGERSRDDRGRGERDRGDRRREEPARAEGRAREDQRGIRREDRGMRAREERRPMRSEEPREMPREDRRQMAPREDLRAMRPLDAGGREAGGGEDERRGRRRRRGGRGRGGGMRARMPVAEEPRAAADAGGPGNGSEPFGAARDFEAPGPAAGPEPYPALGPRAGFPGGEERAPGPAGVGARGPALSSDELVSESTRLTSEFLKAMGFEAAVTATSDGERVEVNASVESDDHLLTGPKGEVRQALQHLLNRMLNRGEGSRYHLQLEINDFWKRREQELEALARDLAEEALDTRAEAVTEYLNAQERRVVHTALKGDPRVKTYALGSGLIKRVAVAPADFPEGPRSD